jgi:hypothetical protein
MLKRIVIIFAALLVGSGLHAQIKDSSNIIHIKYYPRDSATSAHPTVGKVILQSVVGEAAFAGIFFGLNGKPILYQDASENQTVTGIFDWFASLLGSSAAVDFMGNILRSGNGDYGSTLGGAVVGIFLVPIFSSDQNGLFHRSPLFKYFVMSNFPLLGEMAAYYLLPASPDLGKPVSTSDLRIAPFISPQEGGVGVSFIIH